MKQKAFISSLLVFLLIFSFTGAILADEGETTNESEVTEDGRSKVTLEFKDAEEAQWAIGYIGKMKSRNVVSGYPDGTFQPNKPVKRIEAIVMAVRLMGLEEEAKAIPKDTILNFKDSNVIDKQYPWAKGYLVVALENGLFDTSEDKVQPDKPASRVWAASLLVRVLGLEQEALNKMNITPEFVDASDIPGSSIGYVNVAVEQGLLSGYPDGTFKPNKSITRAEMTALLDRTSDGILENDGVVTVIGTVTNVDFDEDTVTEDVYHSFEITIATFNGDSFTYSIASDLIVQYNDSFITADQLKVDDVVTFMVKEDVVVEAILVDKDVVEEVSSGIIELKIKVMLGEEEQFKLKYKNKNGKAHVEVKSGSKGNKEKLKAEETFEYAESFIHQLSFSPDMSNEEIIAKVLTTLEIDNNFNKLEIEIKYSNGEKVEIEYKNENAEEIDEEEESTEEVTEEGYLGIQGFNLDLETKDGQKIKVDYENSQGKEKAEYISNQGGKNGKIKGKEAVELIHSLLDTMTLVSNMDKEDILEQFLLALEIDKDQLEKAELEIQFVGHEEIKIEFDE